MTKVAANLKNPKLFAEWETADVLEYVANVEAWALANYDNGDKQDGFRAVALANAKAELAARGVIA
jgi:hypothetical protein